MRITHVVFAVTSLWITAYPALSLVQKSALDVSQSEKHYVGLGGKRTMHLLKYPFLHPAKFLSKATFPERHPLQAFKKFGELAEPYQPALNAISAASGPVTSVGVFLIPRLP